MDNRTLLPLGVVLLALSAMAVYRFGMEGAAAPASSPPPVVTKTSTTTSTQASPPTVVIQASTAPSTQTATPPAWIAQPQGARPMAEPAEVARTTVAPVSTTKSVKSTQASTSGLPAAADLDALFRSRLEKAIWKEDFMEFQRAYLETFSAPSATRELALASLYKLLQYERLWVRVHVIGWMYQLDDRSQRAQLVQLAAYPEPLLFKISSSQEKKEDARLFAARIIGRHCDRAAAGAVLYVHKQLSPPDLLDDLVHLGVPEAPALLRELQTKAPGFPYVELYGFCGEKRDLVYLNNTFTNLGADNDTRLSAAWAITRIEPNADAAEFIRNQARNHFGDKGYAPLAALRAVQYLGTLKDRESVQLLERVAQEALSNEVARTALANLAYNHSATSAVGRDAVLAEARGSRTKLESALAYRIVMASDDARYAEARTALAKIQAALPWKLTGVHRVPLYNYVVNAPRDR